MSNYTIGILIVFIGVIISRFITERGMKVLSIEEKGRLVEAFSSFRIWNLLPFVLVLIVYFFLKKSGSSWSPESIGIFMGILFLIALASKVFAARKLRTLDLPQSYLKKHAIGQTVSLISLVVFFLLILI
ncbi:MAG: hypothetical protein AB7H80_01380 [Candidatus Kapaibacterium sp.]